MDTRAPSGVTSDLHSPAKNFRYGLRRHAKFALCVLPMLAVIGFGFYFFFIATS
jgi:hypothetical protein